MNLLCRLGWHRPLYDHRGCFVDKVSGKKVYRAECSCGIGWLVDSLCGWLGYKVRRKVD